MTVAPPPDAYLKMISFAEKKSQLRWDQLFLQSFLSGYWIAVYGHAIIEYAGLFFREGDNQANGIARGIFGFLFPGAFVALIYTGAELFTGNTVTMILYLCHKGLIALKPLARVWGLSLLGNFLGTTFGAFFFSYLSQSFVGGSPGQRYLYAIAVGKLSRNFGPNFILAVACNSLVCLATWCTVCSEDGAGKILAIFYCISVFVLGSFEHIIANMYLLSAANFCGFSAYTYGDIIVRNWIPVFLGNLLAGSFFTGALWWYALHPLYTDLAPYTELELVRELSTRYAAANDGQRCDNLKISNKEHEKHESCKQGPLRWKRSFPLGSKKIIKSGIVPGHMEPNTETTSPDTSTHANQVELSKQPENKMDLTTKDTTVITL